MFVGFFHCGHSGCLRIRCASLLPAGPLGVVHTDNMEEVLCSPGNGLGTEGGGRRLPSVAVECAGENVSLGSDLCLILFKIVIANIIIIIFFVTLHDFILTMSKFFVTTLLY